jgi:hypothetical protein
MLLYNVFGLILTVVGFLILKYFPDTTNYQNKGFTLAGILIAIIFILVGIGLIFFG